MATPRNNSVIRAFAILAAFDDRHREMGAAEVAARVGLTAATAHRFLLTLEGVGAVTRGADGRFQLGMTLADLGSRVAPHKVLADAATEHITRLVGALQETIHVAVMMDNMAVIVASEASTRALRIGSQVGRQLPTHCTALGKVLLSGLDETGLETYLGAVPLVRYTAKTITESAAFRRELARVRTHGFAEDNEETEEGLRAFSVPILDAGNEVRAALAVMGPSARLPDRDRDKIVRMLKATASDISARVFPVSVAQTTDAA